MTWLRWSGGWRGNRLTILIGNMATSWLEGSSVGLGVPGDERILKERRQRTTAKLDELECRGREKRGAHLCREMWSKEDLCRNSRRGYAQ